MVVVIDNYDSFTYNLVQYLGELTTHAINVLRNDAATVAEIAAMQPHAIVISPGPCTPKEAGVSVAVIQQLGATIPLLGVCLGHQSIGSAFGGAVVRAPYLMHGKVSLIMHDRKGIFTGMPSPFTATRYHSLILDRKQCPSCLTISAETEDGLIMAVQHKTLPIFGVQFHPESILTEGGKTLLGNFITFADQFQSVKAQL